LNLTIPTVFIFDETQMVYALGCDNIFWTSIKLLAQSSAPVYVLLFAAYGERADTGAIATPIALPAAFGMQEMALTPHEQQELITAWNQYTSQQDVKITPGILCSVSHLDLMCCLPISQILLK